MTIDDAELAEIRKNTAALLELTDDEVDYITSELVNTPATDVREVDPAVFGDEQEDLPGPGLGVKVVPNRITYISEITQGWNGSRWNIMFYANCDRRTRYILWDSDINRWQRDGTCGVGGGRYVYRFKLWWRA